MYRESTALLTCYCYYHILYLAMFPLGTNKVFLTRNLTLILCHLIMFPQDRYTSFWRPEQNGKVRCNCEFNISLLIDYAATALHSTDSLWHDMARASSCYFSSVSIHPLRTVSIHLNSHSIPSPSQWGRHNTNAGTSSTRSKCLYWHLWVQNSFPKFIMYSLAFKDIYYSIFDLLIFIFMFFSRYKFCYVVYTHN